MSSPSKKAKTDLGKSQICILDFGSQFSHLIARRVRELHVYCELYSCKITANDLKSKNVSGIILSGGPSSVYDADAPHLDSSVWDYAKENNIPILGICYGMQEMMHHFKGVVAASAKREYGKAVLSHEKTTSLLFKNIANDEDKNIEKYRLHRETG